MPPGWSNENYLRGVQAADPDGVVRFSSVYPAAYSGRWPHVHFEVYPDLGSIADAGRAIATSQLAFPRDACTAVYASSGYPGRQAGWPHPARRPTTSSVTTPGCISWPP